MLRKMKKNEEKLKIFLQTIKTERKEINKI